MEALRDHMRHLVLALQQALHDQELAADDGLALFTTATAEGTMRLSLEPQVLAPLGENDVLIRVEATPINPSDLGLLTGPADLSKATSSGSGEGVKVTAPVPAAAASKTTATKAATPTTTPSTSKARWPTAASPPPPPVTC